MPPPKPKPVVSVKAASAEAVEGETVTFVFESSREAEEDLPIQLAMVGAYAFTNGDYPSSVTINEGEQGAEIAIETIDDDVDERSRPVEVRVEPGDGYAVHATDSEARTLILDNDLVVNPIPDFLLEMDGPAEEVSLTAFFSDEGETLTYSVISSDPSLVSIGIDGETGMLTLTPNSDLLEGLAELTATASSSNSRSPSASQMFLVEVEWIRTKWRGWRLGTLEDMLEEEQEDEDSQSHGGMPPRGLHPRGGDRPDGGLEFHLAPGRASSPLGWAGFRG